MSSVATVHVCCKMSVVTAVLIGATDAAKLAGVSRSTIHRWLKSAGVQPVMLAPGPKNPQLFDRTDIERLIEAKRATE